MKVLTKGMKTPESYENGPRVSDSTVYEFGEFELDPATRRLSRNDAVIPLTPKVFDTLLYLVEHSGRVLDKDELLAAVWPDVTVEENNLGQAISRIRSSLGEAPGDNRFIVTIPGRGYRFVPEVRTRPALSTAASDSSGGVRARLDTPADPGPLLRPSTGTTGWHSPLFVLGCLAVIVLAVAAVGYFAWTSGFGKERLTTLAVLPFRPLVLESRDEALELGMADTLIGRLGSIPDLTVRPLASVRRFQDPEQTPFAAGAALSVDAVLEGYIHRTSDRVRVTVRLLRVADQQQLWSGEYNEPFTSIFAVQDSVATRVARELSFELDASGQQKNSRAYGGNPAAYESYLQGRFYMNLAQPRNAIKMFEEAAQRDPEFALPFAGLADILSRLPIATDGPSREPIERARGAAQNALSLDGRLGDAFAALGWIGFYHDWDWALSEQHFRTALELNADDFSARLGYAHLLANTGRPEAALREINRALTIDPLSPIALTLKAQFLFYAGRHQEARDQVSAVLRDSPGFWLARLQMGRSHLHDGRFSDALESFQSAQEAGGTWTPLTLIGYTHAASGRTADAERVLRELTTAAGTSYVPPYHIALLHAGLGDTKAAISWLERGVQERDVRMVFVGVDPLWQPMHGVPEFRDLLRRLKLK